MSNDLEAYEDYKVAVSLIDLGGDGLRVAELMCLQELRVFEVYGGVAVILPHSDDCCYGFGAEGVNVSCDFTASPLKLEPETASQLNLEPEHGEEDDTEDDDEEEEEGDDMEEDDEEDYYEEDCYEEDEIWELRLDVQFRQRTVRSDEWDNDPQELEDVSAVYEFLEPFVNAHYLLKWH
jgi:hypothetical protein